MITVDSRNLFTYMYTRIYVMNVIIFIIVKHWNIFENYQFSLFVSPVAKQIIYLWCNYKNKLKTGTICSFTVVFAHLLILYSKEEKLDKT